MGNTLQYVQFSGTARRRKQPPVHLHAAFLPPPGFVRHERRSGVRGDIPSNSMVCIRLRIVTLRTALCHRARPAVRGVVFVVGGDLGFESFGESVAPYDPIPDPSPDPVVAPTPGTSRPAAPVSGPAEPPDPALPAAGAGRNASGSAVSRSDPLAGRGSSSEPVAPYLGGMVLRYTPRLRSPS